MNKGQLTPYCLYFSPSSDLVTLSKVSTGRLIFAWKYAIIRHNQKWITTMSCLQNESILETLFDEVCEEFPNNSEDINATIAYQRFEDLCQ